MVIRLEHPDLHWYFPLPRPSNASTPEKLAAALEDARAQALARFREQPLQPSSNEEARAIYLAAAQALRRRAHRRPSRGERQVFLVADAETLVPQESSPEAANALLKLLEEPTASTSFVLTSSRPGDLLPTIRSRTLSIHVPGLSSSEVEGFLISVAERPPEVAKTAARHARGSIGRALGFLPHEDGDAGALEKLRGEALELLEASLSTHPANGFRIALRQRAWGARGLHDLLAALEEWIRDLAAAAVQADSKITSVERRDHLRKLAESLVTPAAATLAQSPLEEAHLLARGNVNPQLVLMGLVTGLRTAFLQPTRGDRR